MKQIDRIKLDRLDGDLASIDLFPAPRLVIHQSD
jgi:hypothetical protein